jgi:polar amino acid transport system substrate-binding protein
MIIASIRVVLLSAMWIVSCGSLVAEEITIYGDEGYPPYSYAAENQPKGIYVEILRSAFKQMPDYTVTIKMVPWKRALDYIKKGEGMAVFPPYHVEGRASWMDLSEPILEEQVVVFGTSEKLRGKRFWPDDFYGSRIAMNTGFDLAALGGPIFARACASGRIKLREANTSDQNLRKLEMGRVDFYLNDQLTDVSAYPSVAKGLVTASNHGHLGYTRHVSKFPVLKRFRTAFDSVIVKMQAAGEIDAIAESYKSQLEE